jgi:hypothetical protein
MACFDAWDIGACGCAPPATVTVTMPVLGSFTLNKTGSNFLFCGTANFPGNTLCPAVLNLPIAIAFYQSGATYTLRFYWCFASVTCTGCAFFNHYGTPSSPCANFCTGSNYVSFLTYAASINEFTVAWDGTSPLTKSWNFTTYNMCQGAWPAWWYNLVKGAICSTNDTATGTVTATH